MGKVVRKAKRAVKKVTKAPEKIVKKAVRTTKKVGGEIAKAPTQALKYTVGQPLIYAGQAAGSTLSSVAPGLNAVMPAVTQGAALYATGGASAAFSGFGGSGGNMNLLDTGLDILKKTGTDFLSNKFGLNGNSMGSGTMPAEALLGQTQKAVSASQAKTSSMIAGMNQKMMMMAGAGVVLVVGLFLLMRKKR